MRPAPPAPFRATQETEFERLKNRLLTETLLATARPELNAAIRRAANEAAALAWVTFYPLLVFPALFEEKLRTPSGTPSGRPAFYANSPELWSPHESASGQDSAAPPRAVTDDT